MKLDPPERFSSPILNWAWKAGQLLAPVLLALVVSVLLFNFLIMPRFVRHGSEVEVPDVTSLSLEDALERIRESGLAVADTTVKSSPHVAEGHIMDQVPRPRIRIKPDRGIQLVVSRGRLQQKIPRVVGQTLRSARLSLSSNGYRLGEVLFVPSSEVAKGFVAASDPPEGEVFPPGEPIDLLVSAGPEKALWVMPDLAGEELQLTADKLNFAGFVAVIEDSDRRWFGLHRVDSTEPPPGALVAEGDTIRLYGR